MNAAKFDYPVGLTPDDGMVPNAVVGKCVMEGVSMLQAWREHLMLT